MSFHDPDYSTKKPKHPYTNKPIPTGRPSGNSHQRRKARRASNLFGIPATYELWKPTHSHYGDRPLSIHDLLKAAAEAQRRELA